MDHQHQEFNLWVTGNSSETVFAHLGTTSALHHLPAAWVCIIVEYLIEATSVFWWSEAQPMKQFWTESRSQVQSGTNVVETTKKTNLLVSRSRILFSLHTWYFASLPTSNVVTASTNPVSTLIMDGIESEFWIYYWVEKRGKVVIIGGTSYLFYRVSFCN